MNTKIAFVHDRIVHEGGAESVLQTLIRDTQFSQENSQGKLFVFFSTHKKRNDLEVVTAMPKWLNSIFVYFNEHKVFFFSKLLDYRNLMFRFPVLSKRLSRKIKKYGPEKIVISSFAASKNIVLPTTHTTTHTKQYAKRHTTPHTTLYLHSPMQYIRENYEENMAKLTFPIKQFYKWAASYLRPRDKLYREYDEVLFNSKYTARLAEQLYNLKGQVSYPHIDKAFLDEPIATTPKNYFVFVGRVQRYVREIDKIIELCNRFGTPLIVVGGGPDIEYAKKIAGGTIIFVGHVSSVSQKIDIIKHARGLINLSKESFGIATVEALSLGIPVFGYAQGGSLELINQDNGILCLEKDPKTLDENFHRFLSKEFSRENIANNAKGKFNYS